MGLSEDVKEIKDKLIEKENQEQEKLRNKRWRLKFSAKVGKKKARKNWVGILKLNENGSIEPTKQQIIDQTIMVDNVPRLATPDYVLRWNAGRKQFPVMILPSWSIEPLSKEPLNLKKLYEESKTNGTNVVGYPLLLARMKKEGIELKKKSLGWLKWVIGIGAGALVIYVIYTAVTGGFK